MYIRKFRSDLAALMNPLMETSVLLILSPFSASKSSELFPLKLLQQLPEVLIDLLTEIYENNNGNRLIS
jgi:hypothetical protein